MRERILFLALLTEWFKAIVDDNKREEYRELTPYWVKRLFEPTTEFAKKNWSMIFGKALYESSRLKFEESVIEAVKVGVLRPKDFTHVKFTLGYPKRFDVKRISNKFEVTGIRIGKGKAEWGAPNHNVIIISFK
jgi:hypothetical protein